MPFLGNLGSVLAAARQRSTQGGPGLLGTIRPHLAPQPGITAIGGGVPNPGIHPLAPPIGFGHVGPGPANPQMLGFPGGPLPPAGSAQVGTIQGVPGPTPGLLGSLDQTGLGIRPRVPPGISRRY